MNPPRWLTGRTPVERAQQAVDHLEMAQADWDKVRSVAGNLSWRGLLVRYAVGAVAAGGELHHVIRGHGWQARDRSRAHYDRYFRVESRLLHLLTIAALCGAPHAPQGQRSSRRQLLQQAKRIQAAFVNASFYKNDTDEEAARTCVRLSLGLVHHLVSGTPLPADCSVGSSW
ncbi:hypothetical protein [Streptomyces longwoodensis]|uniref:hypothetical protein n=1 Tax=Streptomyces longwoodensis TaxID=68231 RepID=UPI0036E458B0